MYAQGTASHALHGCLVEYMCALYRTCVFCIACACVYLGALCCVCRVHACASVFSCGLYVHVFHAVYLFMVCVSVLVVLCVSVCCLLCVSVFPMLCVSLLCVLCVSLCYLL